jgi:hypothetical protein
MSNQSQRKSVQLSKLSVDFDAAINDAEGQLSKIEERRRELKAAIKGLKKMKQREAGTDKESVPA